MKKFGGPDDRLVFRMRLSRSCLLCCYVLIALHSFISYRTSHYKLHYYETPTSLKFVMVTDTKTSNLRIVLHQIYVSLYVEYGKFLLNLDFLKKIEAHLYSREESSIPS